MKDSYHDRLIETFCANLSYFEPTIGFSVKRTKTNIFFHPKGEIDLIIEGFENEIGLIEAKSNRGVMNKFLSKQFHVYREFNPNASIYLLTGTTDFSLELKDFYFKMYHKGS